jgi:hypothetical protein
MWSMQRLVSGVALVACLIAAGCGTADPEPAPVAARTPPARQDPLALLDTWQEPILSTLAQVKRRKAADVRGDRAAVDRITRDVNRAAERVFALSRDGRLFAATVRDKRLAAAIRRAGDSWAWWADAVVRLRPVPRVTDRERRAATAVADRGLVAIRDFDAAYRAAGAKPPAAFRIG